VFTGELGKTGAEESLGVRWQRGKSKLSFLDFVAN
jgi:hypothetical protein